MARGLRILLDGLWVLFRSVLTSSHSSASIVAFALSYCRMDVVDGLCLVPILVLLMRNLDGHTLLYIETITMVSLISVCTLRRRSLWPRQGLSWFQRQHWQYTIKVSVLLSLNSGWSSTNLVWLPARVKVTNRFNDVASVYHLLWYLVRIKHSVDILGSNPVFRSVLVRLWV